MGADALYKSTQEASLEGTNPVGENYRFLPLEVTKDLERQHKIPGRLIELAALEQDIIPERYQRSIGTVGLAGQACLLNSKVGVLGAGGLGGFALELLARMGIGRMVIVDGDSFTESNLNRQLLATESNMRESKAEAAKKRISAINHSIEVNTYHCHADKAKMLEIYSDCNLIVDCLDSLPSRFDLESACQEMNIIMVHGAIAGFLGQMAVIRPGYPMMAKIYGDAAERGASKGAEAQLGNPAATPAMLASWQAGETVKILAGLDGVLPSGIMLMIDMQSGEFSRLEMDS